MTDAKKLKRQVRERAARTGESYAAARRHVVAQRDAERQARTEQAADDARNATAAGAVSEAKCIEKTGHGFDHWFTVLDRFGAPKKGHTAAARHLKDDHHVSAWYAQSITVLYERARGLRDMNQACTGGFQVSVSRVLPASFEASSPYLANPDHRTRWLAEDPDIATAIEAAVAEGRMRTKDGAIWLRATIQEGTTEVRISSTPDGRSRAVTRVEDLPDSAATERHRARWKARLSALRQLLA